MNTPSTDNIALRNAVERVLLEKIKVATDGLEGDAVEAYTKFTSALSQMTYSEAQARAVSSGSDTATGLTASQIDRTRADYRQSCCICDWSNSGLLNLGEPGKPRWVCHGCIKREFDKPRETGETAGDQSRPVQGQAVQGLEATNKGAPEMDLGVEREKEFREQLGHAVNRCSREQASDTPDFILAEFLGTVLQAYDSALQRRRDWFHRK